MSGVVAIIGRPNVGKSTLFNRLTESKKAIVDEQSGVTRDRHYGKSEWCGKEFTVIDTGGFITGSDDVFEGEIRNQVQLAINECDIILFVTDSKTGITDLDEAVVKILRNTKKPVFLVANKADNSNLLLQSNEFYSFGLGDIYPISAVNGSGTGELLDEVIKHLPEKEEENLDDLPKLAIVGRPNVGKSSLVNALIGEERNIVTDIAGTTRDTLNTHYKGFGFEFLLIDTAGIRKKKMVHEDIEFYSVLRAINAIEYSDVCILMIDAQSGIEKQDLNIYYLIEKNKKGVVVLVNKWDLVDKETNTAKQFEAALREKLAPFNDVPILFISVKEKQRIYKAVEEAMQVHERRIKKIPTSELNEVMLEVIQQTPPPAIKGKYIKIKYVTQLPTHSPSFAFFCNLPQYVKDSYRRFIENQLRKHFDFHGVPIRVFFRKK
jgi:GTPase